MVELSVITVTYNNLDNLKLTVKSVLEQMNSNIEFLIIDGGSKDGTVKYLEHLKSVKGIITISEKDSGIYDAMNKGLKYSSGEWIFYLNAGDIFLPDALRKLIEYLPVRHSYDAVYGNVVLTTKCKGELYYHPEKADINIKHLKKGMICSHQGIVCKRKKMKELGGFDCSFKVAGDWDLISKIYSTGGKFCYIDLYFSAFDRNGISAKPHIMERHRVRKNNNFYHLIDGYFVIDFIHDIKSVFFTYILGKKKEELSIRLKGFQKFKGGYILTSERSK